MVWSWMHEFMASPLLALLVVLSAVEGARIVRTREVCLDAHNKVRKLHKDTLPLKWDSDLAREAEAWAVHLADRVGDLQHTPNLRGQGENLYWRSSQAIASCAQAVLSWYEEISLYDYNYPVFSKATGHFTQLVWRSTTSVGVGIAIKDLRDGYKETFIVARYRPPGNVNSQRYFRKNVRMQKQGVTMPTLFDLDPTMCRDKAGHAVCLKYTKFNFCKRYGRMMVDYCPKMCNLC